MQLICHQTICFLLKKDVEFPISLYMVETIPHIGVFFFSISEKLPVVFFTRITNRLADARGNGVEC